MPSMQSAPGPHVIIDGQRYLYFAGTGYLGLQGHAELVAAACEAARAFGLGSATSRSGLGNNPPTLAVERNAARFFGVDDAFYFVSGYVGNMILARAMRGLVDLVLVDELSHYCVREAAELAGAPVATFAHRDAGALAAALKGAAVVGEGIGGRRPLVMTDGVFAVSGRIAPVGQYLNVLRECDGAVLCIDDAHGVGVLGEHGRGTCEHAGLAADRVNIALAPPAGAGPAVVCCGTLSKAVGGYGGVIAGGSAFIADLKQGSHFYNGASAPPAPTAAATARALELIMAEPDMRRRLADNVRRLKDGLRKLGFDVDDTPVPIVSLTLASGDAMRHVQRQLMSRGVYIAYFSDYAGVGPQGALRIAVFATHTEAMIEQLLDELRRVV